MKKFNINDWIKGKVEPNSLIYNRLDIGPDVYLKHNYPDGKTILEFEKYVCDAINEKREREEKKFLFQFVDGFGLNEQIDETDIEACKNGHIRIIDLSNLTEMNTNGDWVKIDKS